MRVLDLFSGLGGFSQAFKDRGHEVIRVDNSPAFCPDYYEDVSNLGPEHFNEKFDIILASPPCNAFTRAAMQYYWIPGEKFIPASLDTIKFITLVYHTHWLIRSMKPTYWIIENPMANLRKIYGPPKATISFCRYNDEMEEPPMKRTDLWGELPPFELKDCKNNNAFCNHADAPRGSKTGTQGLPNSEERAKIPYGLSLAICKAVESGEGPQKTLRVEGKV